MMAKRCLYKQYHLLNISLDNRVSFSSLSESRRFLLRSLSLRSLASAVSESRQFFAACEDCAARLALSLPQRLDNRVSSSSALSTHLSVSCARCCNFMRVLSLNWNYGMCSAREKSLPDVRLGSGVSTCKISGAKNMAPGTALALHLI